MNIHVAATSSAHALSPETSAFAQDAIEGLQRSQKTLPPKYFYDPAGSELFEAITALREYYPTRTELAILRDHAGEIGALAPHDAALVEFGAGATTKARVLLAACRYAAYVPVDISGEFISAQASALRHDFPRLYVHPVVADFTTRFALPADVAAMPKVGFFPGSTLGNFEPHEAKGFLRNARGILGDGALLIVGIDLEKDVGVLTRAYNDASGVTARFNLNVLKRINAELGGDFDLSGFDHRAIYNSERHRIEMHLVSRRPQTVSLLGRGIAFRTGETIHTECSYKYSLPRFAALARSAGWVPRATWTDAEQLFSVHALIAES